MKKAIILLALLAMPLAYSLELVITQEQLDGFDIDTFTWQTLLCNSTGYIGIAGSYVYTPYSCLTIEPHPDYDDQYILWDAYYYAYWPLYEAEYCVSYYTIEWCTDYYYGIIAEQALTRVNNTLQEMREYQTGYGSGEWEDWEGDIFG